MGNDILGLFGVILSSLLFVPQLIHMIRDKATKDISYYFLALACTTYIVWIIYGFTDKSTPIILSSGIALLMTILMLATKKFYEWAPPQESLLNYQINDL